MLILSGVLATDFRRRKQHVHEVTLPCVWGSRLRVREDGVCGRSGDLHDCAASGILSLFGMWFPGGDWARAKPSAVPRRVDWQQAGVLGVGGPPGGVSWLRGRATGHDRLRRPACEFPPSLSSLCLGALPVHDDQGRRPTPEYQLGCDQGASRPSRPICPTPPWCSTVST